jgi:hypothetical protein
MDSLPWLFVSEHEQKITRQAVNYIVRGTGEPLLRGAKLYTDRRNGPEVFVFAGRSGQQWPPLPAPNLAADA